MRALLVALVVLAAAGRAGAAEVLGYDHTIHDGYVEVKGIDAPTCGFCHQIDKRLEPVKPGHAACFGGPCHAMPKTGEAAAVGARSGATLCLACHTEARPRARARFVWAGDASRDFGLTFAHSAHAAPAGCLDCHVAPSGRAAAAAAASTRKPGGAHERCTGCHVKGGRAFAASDCERCHRAIAGRFVAPTQVQSPYAVGATFSHDKHLARQSGPMAARCLACHAEVNATQGAQVPAPTMISCESCHDGKKAFAALGDRCTRCHTRGDALPSPEPPRRFEHRTHVAAGAPRACEACHTLDAAGTPRAVAHAACSDARCHAADFRASAPVICGGCHVGTEPWRPLEADAGRRARSEWGVEMSHVQAAHGARACADCHTGIRGGPEMRLGRGHASCQGAGCHTVAPAAKAPEPALAACTACHQLGLLPARDERRAADRWSVAARFRHGAHREDGLGQPVVCAACHNGVDRARRVAEITPPTKPACAACHDGVLGFKMTGHACGRCHLHQDPALP